MKSMFRRFLSEYNLYKLNCITIVMLGFLAILIYLTILIASKAIKW